MHADAEFWHPFAHVQGAANIAGFFQTWCTLNRKIDVSIFGFSAPSSDSIQEGFLCAHLKTLACTNDVAQSLGRHTALKSASELWRTCHRNACGASWLQGSKRPWSLCLTRSVQSCQTRSVCMVNDGLGWPPMYSCSCFLKSRYMGLIRQQTVLKLQAAGVT